MEPKIVLASASPRRRELLRRIVPEFETVVSGCPERAEAEDPALLARLLAEEKARDVRLRRPDAIVIGADTVVALGRVRYGKPRDREDAERMLRDLSGREHVVHTGVCVIGSRFFRNWTESGSVRFARLSERFLEEYLATDIPWDKAGGYGIQCRPTPVESFRGELETIMGLPLLSLRQVLREAIAQEEE